MNNLTRAVLLGTAVLTAAGCAEREERYITIPEDANAQYVVERVVDEGLHKSMTVYRDGVKIYASSRGYGIPGTFDAVLVTGIRSKRMKEALGIQHLLSSVACVQNQPARAIIACGDVYAFRSMIPGEVVVAKDTTRGLPRVILSGMGVSGGGDDVDVAVRTTNDNRQGLDAKFPLNQALLSRIYQQALDAK